MFGVSGGELLLVLVVSVLVLRPSEMGKVLYTLGRWVRHIKDMVAPLKNYTHTLMQEAELDHIKEKAFQDMQALEKEAQTKKEDLP